MAPNKRESVEPYIVITCEEAFAHETKKGVVKDQDSLWGAWGEQGMSVAHIRRSWYSAPVHSVRQVRRHSRYRVRETPHAHSAQTNLTHARYSVRKLKELHPKATVVAFSNANIVGFPGAYLQPLAPSETVTEMIFFPVARQAGQANGIVATHVRFGSFNVAWDVSSRFTGQDWTTGAYAFTRNMTLSYTPSPYVRH